MEWKGFQKQIRSNEGVQNEKLVTEKRLEKANWGAQPGKVPRGGWVWWGGGLYEKFSQKLSKKVS